MTYQEPSLESICSEINQMMDNYSEKKQSSHEKSNDVRRESITLIQRLSEHILSKQESHKKETLISILLFALLKLEKKYGSFSGWLPKDRGCLTQLLKKALGLSDKNVLSAQEQLIYFSHLLDFAKQHVDDSMLSDTHYHDKATFIASIELKLKQTISAQRDYFDYVLKESPDFDSLDRNIDQAITEYEAAYKARFLTQFTYFKNTEREATVELAKIIQASCKQSMTEIEKHQLDNKFLAVQKANLYDVRRGFILSVVMPIYTKEYGKLSPYGSLFNSGSLFFQKLLSALNKHYKDFTHDERIRLLKTYLGYLERNNIPGLNIKAISETVNHLVAEEEMDKNTPSYQEVYTSIAINYATQYGLKLIVAQATSDLVMPSVGTMLVGASTGPLGIISYGIAGAAIQSQLGQLVQEQVIDRVTAMAYEYILTAIGTYIGRITAPNIMLTFERTGTSLANLMGFYQDLERLNEGFERKEEWLKTLHHLPNNLVSEREKRILAKTKSSCF